MKTKQSIIEPLPFRMLKRWYPKLEMIAPPLAYSLAFKLFFSPIRFKQPKREQPIVDQANKIKFTINSKEVQFYSWGATGNPVAVVVHGWSGRASQFFTIIESLRTLGYQVIGFDAPAHGQSDGKTTNIKEFYQALEIVQQQYGKIDVSIGHSFGGVALLYAASRGMELNNVITISSPTIGDDILKGFSKKINASEKTGNALRKLVYIKFNIKFEDITACQLIKSVHIGHLLILHDKNDMEVPFSNGVALHELAPTSTLILTQNLGHTRILRDKKTSKSIEAFISKIKLEAV